jgi:hypothetical protein
MTALIDVETSVEINEIKFFQSISGFYNVARSTQHKMNKSPYCVLFYFWKSTFCYFIYEECSSLIRMYAKGSV